MLPIDLLTFSACAGNTVMLELIMCNSCSVLLTPWKTCSSIVSIGVSSIRMIRPIVR